MTAVTTSPSGRADRALFGIGLVLIAYGLFSSIDASAKWMLVLGYPAMQLAFMRYFVQLLITTGRVLYAGHEQHLWRSDHTVLVVIRGALLLGTTVGNFIALKYIQLTLTSTIFFSVPIIVCLLSGTMLGEKVGRWRWGAILFGFVGVLIAIRPFGADFHWAALISLAGVTCFAFYLLLTRHFAGEMPTDTLQFYTGLVGTIAMLPFAFYFWRWPQNLLEGALLIGIGAFSWVGHEFLIRAYRYADASVLTPYSYSFMLYLTVWSFVLFGHYPDRPTIIGAALVVTSGLVIWLREQARARSLAAAALPR